MSEGISIVSHRRPTGTMALYLFILEHNWNFITIPNTGYPILTPGRKSLTLLNGKCLRYIAVRQISYNFSIDFVGPEIVPFLLHCEAHTVACFSVLCLKGKHKCLFWTNYNTKRYWGVFRISRHRFAHICFAYLSQYSRLQRHWITLTNPFFKKFEKMINSNR